MYIYVHLRIHCPLRERVVRLRHPRTREAAIDPRLPPGRAKTVDDDERPPWGLSGLALRPPSPPSQIRQTSPSTPCSSTAAIRPPRPDPPPPVRHHTGGIGIGCALARGPCWYLTLEGMHSSHHPPGTRGIDAVCHTSSDAYNNILIL